MKAAIITIGDEILIGQIVDTNSVSISKHLNSAGITVVEKLSIGDAAEQITQTLQRVMAFADVVIITGGLGPTKDDITKFTLARIFSSPMREDSRVATHVREMLAARGIEYNELNRSQAMVPERCEVLFNTHGTAPGMLFVGEQGQIVVSLPGVPFEMEHLMVDEVMPRLRARLSLHANIHRTMITAGVAESILAERISEWEDSLPAGIKLAYLPAPNVVRLRLSAYDVENEALMRQTIDVLFDKLYKIIPDNIVGFENASMQELIHNIMCERGLTLSTAESCTGGTIASRFTAMAGASAYFKCGVVAYANEAKRDVLGVNYEDIMRYGAVSEQVARQMAEGARRVGETDYAIATTGIAGPTGGSAEKPVGTVWIAVATPTHTVAVKRNCGTDRGQIVNRASAYAIEMLYKELKKGLAIG
ncbi:MAG: CinA family nicotinamide mononucleotide deamidase-related protein [Alistipes sp.]|nr:CinA family nicotinamide mononucleotide deamidase-related protein [Alistipes sp.]